MSNIIEIKEYCGEGYKPQIVYGAWRVALANYTKTWEYGHIPYIERHMETDEVFVLLSGTASLYIGEEKKEYKMECGKLYNVKRGTWHQMAMLPDSKVLIVENDDTSKENSEFIYYDK